MKASVDITTVESKFYGQSSRDSLKKARVCLPASVSLWPCVRGNDNLDSQDHEDLVKIWNYICVDEKLCRQRHVGFFLTLYLKSSIIMSIPLFR